MSEPLPLDPMALWRDAVAQWEKGINDVAGQALGSSEFARGMHGAMGTSLSAQKTVSDAIGRYLGTVNLPSRAEVAALGERLSEIESRLIRMTALLEHLVDPAAAGVATSTVTRVPRTRRPPPREAAEAVEAPPARGKAVAKKTRRRS